MKKKRFIIILGCFACLFQGCSSYWYQEGKSFEECEQARAQCRNELLKRSDFKNLTVQYEVEFMKDCMGQKGYKQTYQNDLPLNVKREEPDSTLHWRAVGLAGTIE
jgi:hypothetical protein